MSWNGHKVIDMDTHVYERPDRMYGEFLDSAYREPYNELCSAIEKQQESGLNVSLFGTRHAVIEPFEAGRPLGVTKWLFLQPTSLAFRFNNLTKWERFWDIPSSKTTAASFADCTIKA